MARVQDNWERLVRATLRREQLRTTTGPGHERHPSVLASMIAIEEILQAADEIQYEDRNVARILCEQAYSMAQNLDSYSNGSGVLKFKAGLMSVIKLKRAKMNGAQIDRSHDDERLLEFYRRYKQRYRVDDIQREEQIWRQSGVLSTNFGPLMEMRKVFATLRALVEAMKYISKDAAPNVGKLILEELRRIEKSDAAFSDEMTPYNNIPLEAPSSKNATGVFPEHGEFSGKILNNVIKGMGDELLGLLHRAPFSDVVKVYEKEAEPVYSGIRKMKGDPTALMRQVDTYIFEVKTFLAFEKSVLECHRSEVLKNEISNQRDVLKEIQSTFVELNEKHIVLTEKHAKAKQKVEAAIKREQSLANRLTANTSSLLAVKEHIKEKEHALKELEVIPPLHAEMIAELEKQRLELSEHQSSLKSFKWMDI